MKTKKKSKEKKEIEVCRLPLPTRTKLDQDGDVDVETDDPKMEKFLQNFKNLCGLDKSSQWEDFIKVSADQATKQFSAELESGLGEEDRYLKEDGDIVVQTKQIQIEEDYSGAAPAVIKEKIGKKKAKKLRKEEREKTKGKDWFNMSAPEMTEERKLDLEVIQMRGAADPKRFYKKSDSKDLPKYFQIGTVVDSPYDFYSDRIPKKDRKRTLVDELLADAEFKKYNKRKYVQIIQEQSAGKRFKPRKKKKEKA